MTLIEQINSDFKEAFKAKELVKKNFLAVLKGEIQTQSTKVNGLDAPAVIKAMKKSLDETVIKGSVQNIEDAKKELEFLAPYLPTLMSKEDVTIIVKGLIDGGKNNIGMVMQSFNKEHKGKADNNLVKEIAMSLL